MVIMCAAEVVKFQIVQTDTKPELEGLQHVSIGIDDNNFPRIFPPHHVEFLDRLKGHKRRSEGQLDQSKRSNPPPPQEAKPEVMKINTEPLGQYALCRNTLFIFRIPRW